MHTCICLSSRRFLTGGFCLGFFVWKVLSGVVFVSLPLLSEYIHYNRMLNITFNFRFHMYENCFKVWRHMLLDLVSLCHKLSHFLGPPLAWRTLCTALMLYSKAKMLGRSLIPTYILTLLYSDVLQVLGSTWPPWFEMTKRLREVPN